MESFSNLLGTRTEQNLFKNIFGNILFVKAFRKYQWVIAPVGCISKNLKWMRQVKENEACTISLSNILKTFKKRYWKDNIF